MSDETRSVQVELSEYERDNLLAELIAVSGKPGPSPLNVANTGDWVMTVAYKLGYIGATTDFGHPNVDSDDLVERALAWEASHE